MTQLSQSQVTTASQPALYWAVQAASVTPACFVKPENAGQVSLVVKTAKQYQCPFAIRGGGHSDVPFASNSPGGITLDLGALNDIELSQDKTVTQVGAGLAWGDVYQALDPQNLTVVGGRETTVGVAGLTLGGGISYISGLYGLACDNVKNYEVVLADGSIVDANSSGEYQLLYKALRGGGNNFGIVTRFDLDTYAQGDLHGGLVVWKDSPQTATDLIGAFTTFANSAPSDPNAAIFTSIDYAGNGTYYWANGLNYAKPVSQNPKIFAPFYTSYLNSTQMYSTERLGKQGNLATELGVTQPSGRRQQFHTATYRADTHLANKMVAIFREESAKALAAPPKNATGIMPNFSLQPLSTNIMKQMLKRGGNVLGLTPNEAPLMVLSMSWPWNSPEDDALIVGAMNNVVSRSNTAAKEMGLANEYIYMNYAPPGLPVISSYGEDNVEFLQAVSRLYDPEGVFQKLVPGGFKLPSM